MNGHNTGGIAKIWVFLVEYLVRISYDKSTGYCEPVISLEAEITELSFITDTGKYSQSPAKETHGLRYDVKVSCLLRGVNPDNLVTVEKFNNRKVGIIMLDNNGYYHLAGLPGEGHLFTSAQEPGEDFADRNHININISGTQSKPVTFISNPF